jgi:hypothetical protein
MGSIKIDTGVPRESRHIGGRRDRGAAGPLHSTPTAAAAVGGHAAVGDQRRPLALRESLPGPGQVGPILGL